jgi:hypothetical protein
LLLQYLLWPRCICQIIPQRLNVKLNERFPTAAMLLVSKFVHVYNKVNLSLCLSKHYAMKAYWGVAV